MAATGGLVTGEVDAVFQLEEVEAAVGRAFAGRRQGKVLLQCSPDTE